MAFIVGTSVKRGNGTGGSMTSAVRGGNTKVAGFGTITYRFFAHEHRAQRMAWYSILRHPEPDVVEDHDVPRDEDHEAAGVALGRDGGGGVHPAHELLVDEHFHPVVPDAVLDPVADARG